MALSDLAVFSDYVYTAQTEVLAQQIDLFNSASMGTIMLATKAHVGNYDDTVFWAKVAGLVRRRNPFGSGAVAEKVLAQLVDTMVKIAAGTPPVRIDPGMMKWIQREPAEAGAVIGQQLAGDTLADMLNTAISATSAALSGVAGVNYDGTAGVATPSIFNNGQALFGDRYTDIAAWVMHSKPLFDIYANAITNAAHLFTFGTVNVKRDPFGRPMIISDSPGLFIDLATDQYVGLGLVPGAVRIDQNADFTDNVQTLNGDENIKRTYQAEWSYELGIKGFTWDKVNGLAAPNDAALFTSTNWDKIVTSIKDLAGVRVRSL
jgi:hypothetical protein